MNSLSFVNPNCTYTPIGAIERLKLARAQASADLDKLLSLKTEQKKIQMFTSNLSRRKKRKCDVGNMTWEGDVRFVMLRL